MLVIALLGTALAQQPEAPQAPSRPLELAAAWEESSYFAWATELAGKLGEPRLLVQPTAGSGDNLNQLASGRVDLALAQSDVAWHAWADSGRIVHDAELVAIGRAHSEAVHLMVLTDSPVQTVADLKGLRVDVNRTGSGSLFNGLDVLHAAGVEAELDFGGAFLVERLVDGRIDAALFTTRTPFGDFEKHKDKIRIVSLGPTASGLADAPYYHKVKLDPAYGEGDTVAVDALLVTHASLADATVTAILDAGMLTPEGVTVPLHPAAKKWFQAKQMALEATTKEFEPHDLPALPPPVDVVTFDEGDARYLEVEQVVVDALTINPILGVSILSKQQRDVLVRGAKAARQPFFNGGLGTAGTPNADTGETDKTLSENVAVGVDTWTGTAVTAAVSSSKSALDQSGTWGSTAQLTVAQDLLDGMFFDQNFAGVRRAEIDARVAASQMQQSAISLVAGTQNKFYDLAEAHARRSLRARQVSLAEHHVNRVRQRAALDGNDLPVQEAGDALAKAEEALLREDRTIRDLEDSLLDDLDAKFGYRLVPVGDLERDAAARAEIAGTLEERIETALQRRPDLAQRDLALARSRVDLAESRRLRLPALGVNGNVGFTSAEQDNTLGSVGAAFDEKPFWGAGTSISVPLGHNPDFHLMAQRRIAVEQKEVERNDALENARREVRAAWRAMDTARKRLEVAERSRSLADRKLSLAIDAYRADETDSFKVLTYQTDFLNAQLLVLAAATDFLQALAELDRVTGVGADPWSDLLDRRVDEMSSAR